MGREGQARSVLVWSLVSVVDRERHLPLAAELTRHAVAQHLLIPQIGIDEVPGPRWLDAPR
jgi:hypothetical protein